MKVAVYHNLPAGGALRAVGEFLRRVGPDVTCDLFTIDFEGSPVARFAPNAGAVRQGFADDVRAVISASFSPRFWSGVSGGRLSKVDLVRGLRCVEREIAAQINNGGYDVAYVQPCWASQTPSILVDLKLPKAYYMHEIRRASFEPGYLFRARPRSLKAALARIADQVFESTLRRRDIIAAQEPDRIACNSQYTAESIRQSYGRSATVAYLGVDGDTFTLPISTVEERPFVLSVGGLERFKGHHHVVEAVARIPAGRRPAISLVYERCDRAYRRELLDLATRRQVALDEHQGISDIELAALYGRALATVLAATKEPFGLVALESMACGTPVIAVPEAGYRETVSSGVNGLLVERSPAAMAEAIQEVVDGRFQHVRADIHRTTLSAWGWDAAIGRQLSLLEDVARGGRQ